MAWDYSRCAWVKYGRDDPDHYTVHHYGRKPDVTVMVDRWWRVRAEVYSGAVFQQLGLETAPTWRPDGAGVQLSML